MNLKEIKTYHDKKYLNQYRKNLNLPPLKNQIHTIHFLDENGVKEGVETSYFLNGELSCEFNYKEGKLDGDYTAYHYKEGGRGSIRCKGKYKNGELQGGLEYFDENGNLID